jgi:hypothetical protein
MSKVVQLEAFESSLKGCRIRWFLTPGSPAIYPPGFQEQLFTESPPFQKRILITSEASLEGWKLLDKWDIIMLPTTPTEWSLIVTLILNLPSPCFVVCTPEVKAPQGFFTKCAQIPQKAPTIICFQTLSLPLPQASVSFHATFFPPAKAVEDTLMDAMQEALKKLVSADKLGDFTVKDALKDLRGAGATLAVSSIEDPEPSLYWYYATESKFKGRDSMSSVIQTLLSRGF